MPFEKTIRDVGMPCMPDMDAIKNAQIDELVAALRDILRIAKAASIGVSGNAPRIARAEAAIAKAEAKC